MTRLSSIIPASEGGGVSGNYDPDDVDINGGSIDGTAIGAATPGIGSFTTLDASGDASVSGNLSVGTDTPDEKLHVVGNAIISGTVNGRDVAADGAILDNIGALPVLVGEFAPSGGSFPGGGTAQKGEFWIATDGGTIDSQAISADDRVTALVDNASTSSAADWNVSTISSDVQSVAGLSGIITASGLRTAINVEDGADVTDATNVTAAGALMDSELTDIAAVKALNQGVSTTDTPTFAGANYTGDIKALNVVGKFNVKWHGAVGNGSTNDSGAVQDCLDYALANNGPMELPVGKFLLNSAIIANVGGAARKTGILGQGQGCSEFIVPSGNTTGAILINVESTADKSDQAVFRDFSIACQASGGVGLRFKQLAGGVQDLNTVIVDSVRAWVDMTGSKYFDIVFDFDGAWRPLINNVFWAGPVSGYDHTPSDPALSSLKGLNLDNAYDPIVSNTWIKGTQTAVSIVDTRGGNESEAVRISDCVFNQCNYGIRHIRSTREPLFMMDSTHINYKIAGIELDGARTGHIHNCLIYNEDTTNEWGGSPTDIRLKNASEMIITDNTFHFDGHSNRVGIYVDDDGEFFQTGAGHDNIIENNIFRGTFDKAIVLDTGSDGNLVRGNLFLGTITTPIQNLGTNNTVSEASAVTLATAGTTTVGAMTHNGTTKASGKFYSGTTNPSNTTRLNYDGNLTVQALSTVAAFTCGGAMSASGYFTCGSGGLFRGNLNLQGNRLTNIAAPSASEDAANKTYVDAQVGASDYRLKTNVRPSLRYDDILSRLKIYDFEWKDGGTSTGVLAHEAAEVIPEIVIGEKDGDQVQRVRYDRLVPYLVKGLQEAMARIEELEARQ